MIKPILKPKPIKKKKKSKLTTQQKITRLRNKADRLYQEVGRKRYEDVGCLVCDEEYSCLHHYFPKSTCSALRYNFENGINIGVKCHYRIHSSDDPSINNAILKEKGFEWLERLEAIKRDVQIKPSIKYYKSVIAELEKEL